MQTMSKMKDRMNPPMAIGTTIGCIGCPAMLAGVRMVFSVGLSFPLDGPDGATVSARHARDGPCRRRKDFAPEPVRAAASQPLIPHGGTPCTDWRRRSR